MESREESREVNHVGARAGPDGAGRLGRRRCVYLSSSVWRRRGLMYVRLGDIVIQLTTFITDLHDEPRPRRRLRLRVLCVSVSETKLRCRVPQ